MMSTLPATDMSVAAGAAGAAANSEEASKNYHTYCSGITLLLDKHCMTDVSTHGLRPLFEQIMDVPTFFNTYEAR